MEGRDEVNTSNVIQNLSSPSRLAVFLIAGLALDVMPKPIGDEESTA